jgi:hypothetical protein
MFSQPRLSADYGNTHYKSLLLCREKRGFCFAKPLTFSPKSHKGDILFWLHHLLWIAICHIAKVHCNSVRGCAFPCCSVNGLATVSLCVSDKVTPYTTEKFATSHILRESVQCLEKALMKNVISL